MYFTTKSLCGKDKKEYFWRGINMKQFYKQIARVVAFVLVAALLLPTIVVGRDAFILTDDVDNTYNGRPQMASFIQQLQFTDLPANPAAQDLIIRAHALEIFRPTSPQFRPDASVTWEEGISYALRLAGLSQRARQLGQDNAGVNLPGTPLDQIWARGYLQLARDIGIITPAEFTAATTEAILDILDEVLANLGDDSPPPDGADDEEEPVIVIPEVMPFTPGSRIATREEIASWIVGAMEYAQSDIFNRPTGGFSIQTFSDWNTISPARVAAVETLLSHNVMNGQTSTIFGPDSVVSRVEMGQIISNLDSFYHQLMGFERVVGTVGNIVNEYFFETGFNQAWRQIFIRRADGNVDVLTTTVTVGGSPQSEQTDAVVLRDGVVTGLAGLEIGDQIEYLIHSESGEVWYVHVVGQSLEQVFRGRLEAIDMEEGIMTFSDAYRNIIRFPMSQGLFGIQNGVEYIRFTNVLRPANELPRGVYYDVILMNNIIMAIEFVGTMEVAPETWGIVIDNNPLVGSITIIDRNRIPRSFTYNPGELRVQRRVFFDMRDTIGGLHDMFQNFNPRETSMSEIQLGDIVSFAVSEDDPFRIISISAAENTITRYGRIREVRDQGGFFDILVEFDGNQTAWYTFVEGVLILDRGRPAHPNQIQVGDWARFVISQAVLAPGVMVESVREIVIDGGGHHVSSIVMGTLAGFNASQNQITVRHAQTLTPAGWSNHQQLATFNIGGANVRYYFNGNPITLAHLNRYLQHSDATVYLALENHFAGERALMVSVRSGRDELLRSDLVLASNNNQINLFEIAAPITTDPGTIVVRNGRLVEHTHVFAPDWARVSLNGGNNAAIVSIDPPPVTSGVQIARGRVSQVFPNQSFRVETTQIFDGLRWNFTPIAREFTIDHDTIFINSGGGVTSIDQFVGWGDDTAINEIFNIVIDGGRAARVIEAPFTAPIPSMQNAPGHLTLRGIIYDNAGGTVSLRDVSVFNALTGQWTRISNVNATATVTIPGNAIVVDRNEVIHANRLQVGQQIMALSPENRTAVTIEPGMQATAYLVFVES